MTKRRSPPVNQQMRAPASLARQSAHPVATLQTAIGNRAIGQVLARSPTTTGTVKFGKLGSIEVSGGNLEDWTKPGEAFDTVDVTSKEGKHSAKLRKASTDRTKADVTVEIKGGKGGGQQGGDLKVARGVRLEIKNARISGYAVDKRVETWRLTGFEKVNRTTITSSFGK